MPNTPKKRSIYSFININSKKDPKEYSALERRGEILKLVKEAGHPDLVSQVQLGERYGVSNVTIHNDMNKLKAEIVERCGKEIVHLSELIFNKSIKHYSNKNKWDKAVDCLEKYNKWLFDAGKQQKAAERQEVSMNANIVTSEDFANAFEEFKRKKHGEKRETV